MMYIANEGCIYLASYLILWLWLKVRLDTHLQTQTHRHTYLGGVDIVQAQQQYVPIIVPLSQPRQRRWQHSSSSRHSIPPVSVCTVPTNTTSRCIDLLSLYAVASRIAGEAFFSIYYKASFCNRSLSESPVIDVSPDTSVDSIERTALNDILQQLSKA